jgi:hypothetical protein
LQGVDLSKVVDEWENSKILSRVNLGMLLKSA